MRLRLPELDRSSERATRRCSALYALVWCVACGGNTFSATSASSEDAGRASAAGSASAAAAAGTSGSPQGDGGSGGDSGSGGDAPGNGGNAGSAGSGLMAGAGGKAALLCDCAAGNYCQDGTNKCRSCVDFSRLEFASPQRLTTLAQAPLSSERFPRAAQKPSALFYTLGGAGKERIWYTATPVSGTGALLSSADDSESGPLFAPGLVDQKDFFFERLDANTGDRKIMFGSWSGTAITDATLATLELNAAGSSDYSVAVAPNVKRIYWMSTRHGMPELLWETVTASPGPQVLNLNIKAGANPCPRQGDDATPWVNLNGTLLLFRSQSLNESCTPNDSGAYDLFAVPLAKDGTAAGTAVPLASLNNTGGMSNETDPSLAPDSCSIYFASDNGRGDYDLYRAARN